MMSRKNLVFNYVFVSTIKKSISRGVCIAIGDLTVVIIHKMQNNLLKVDSSQLTVMLSPTAPHRKDICPCQLYMYFVFVYISDTMREIFQIVYVLGLNILYIYIFLSSMFKNWIESAVQCSQWWSPEIIFP